MNVLVDSSVWVGHFKQRNAHLVQLLEQGLVICHPYVVAEIACGTPPSRQAIINMLADLESAPVATQDELLTMMNTRKLFGRGCGFVDMSLMASSLISEKLRIWTVDKRFELIASVLGLAYKPRLNS
jgi:predicted nucleic acid-binding protein